MFAPSARGWGRREKMREPSMGQGRMLATLATLLRVYVESGQRIPDLERDLKDGTVKAIRRLIEKVGEWQIEAESILNDYDFTGCDDVFVVLARQIRDFGKDGKNEILRSP